ncbi:MAG TPA: esterase-like activity of phytase family protein [Phycisphaerales bacterium]|nr:esterase-like activity of phytase family protein [Phycisphaerales bacterium]
MSIFSSVTLGLTLLVQPALAQFELLKTTTIPGEATDFSGLKGTDIAGNSNALLGSFGSGIDYDPATRTYVTICDRGPFDGASDFQCRVQIFRTAVDPGGYQKFQVKLIKTVMLTAADGTPFMGSLNRPEPKLPAPDGSETKIPQRYDPESIRVAQAGPAGAGTWWISDEYGPWIDQFDATGKHLRRLELPARYAIANPAVTYQEEMPPANTAGRQANRGFESLAISPDGTKLFAMTQSPLIQDSALDDRNRRKGINMRLLEITLPTSWETDPKSADKPTFKEYLYQLDDARDGVNEILAVNDRDLLVLERDSKGGMESKKRGIFRVSLAADSPLNKGTQPSDISAIDVLPQREVPEGVTPLTKEQVLNFMDPKWELANDQMPEKLEGITLGETIGGKRVLLVTSDNDLQPAQPTHIWAFLWDMARSELPALPKLEAQPPIAPPIEPAPEQPAEEPPAKAPDQPAPDPLIHPAPTDMPKR